MFKAPKTRWAVVHASSMRATRPAAMCVFPILAMHEKKSRTVAPENAWCQPPYHGRLSTKDCLTVSASGEHS
jgi:hypothetical protein